MDAGKAGGGALAAVAYENLIAQGVVEATTRDAHLSPLDFLLVMTVGWGPMLGAAYMGGPFWASFAGGITYNRIDNIVKAMGIAEKQEARRAEWRARYRAQIERSRQRPIVMPGGRVWGTDLGKPE